MKYLLILFLLPCALLSQERPDLRLKAYTGVGAAVYLIKNEALTDTSGYFASIGYQGGFGFRVSRKRLMAEVNFDFLRHATLASILLDDVSNENEDNLMVLYSFELPINAGFITLKTPLVKHYLYGGFTTHFNVKGFVNYPDDRESLKLKPKETLLTNPAFLMRLGTQLDVAFFNFDFNYSLGLNNSFKKITRVQSHFLQFNVGLIF